MRTSRTGRILGHAINIAKLAWVLSYMANIVMVNPANALAN